MGIGLDGQKVAHQVKPVAIRQHQVQKHNRRQDVLERGKAGGRVIDAQATLWPADRRTDS